MDGVMNKTQFAMKRYKKNRKETKSIKQKEF